MAEENARKAWERSADSSFEAAQETLDIVSSSDVFLAAESDLNGLRAVIENATEAQAEAAEDAAKAVEDIFGDVAGADDVKSPLTKARRALRSRSFDPVEAMEFYEVALEEYAKQKAWRAEATTTVKPQIEAYVETMRSTLGARVQERLSDEQALYLAACTAGHRDLSLNF